MRPDPYSESSPSEQSTPVTAENPELVKLILAEPDRREHYEVYADWLQSQGDPRGEWIVLRLRAEDALSPGEESQRSRAEAKLLKEHRAQLLGPVAESEVFTATWSRGFARSLAVDCPRGREAASSFREQINALLTHASCSLVRELKVRVSRDSFCVGQLVQALQKYPLEGLSTAALCHERSDLDPSLLHELLRAWSGVLRLIMQYPLADYGFFQLPETRELYFVDSSANANSLRELQSARWPKLKLLHLPTLERDVTAELLDVLLLPARCPELRVLSLEGWRTRNDSGFYRALLTSELLPQLQELHLGRVKSFRVLAELLINEHEAFQHLRRITLDTSEELDSESQELLTRIYGNRLSFEKEPITKQLAASLGWDAGWSF